MNVFSRALRLSWPNASAAVVRGLLMAALFSSGAVQAQTGPIPEAPRNQVPGAQQGFPQQGFPQQGFPQPGAQQGMPQGAAQGAQQGMQGARQPEQPASPVLPPMSLSRQFAGPLPETAIQRFVDPETGVLCYLYTPYRVPHERNETGVLIYGPNNIGSISCVAPAAPTRPATADSLSALPAPRQAAPAGDAQGAAANGASAATNSRGAASGSSASNSNSNRSSPAPKSAATSRNKR